MPLALFILAGLALLAVWRAGYLRPDALTHTPRREVEFSDADRVVGFGFFAVLFLPLAAGAALPEGVGLTIGLLALPAAAFFFAVNAAATGAGLRKAGFIPRRPGRDIVAAALGLPVGFLFTAVGLQVGYLVGRWVGDPAPDGANHVMLELLQKSDSRAEIIGIVVQATLLASVFEEACFRGLLQTLLIDTLGRRRRWAAVCIAAGLFAAIHLSAVTWHALPGLFVLGVVLGWVYERTGSLLPCVLIHAGFNAINLWAAWAMRVTVQS